MRRKLIFLLLAGVFWCPACNNKAELKELITHWQGQELLFPADMQFKVLGKDTLCPDVLSQPYKILCYVDSAGCTGCRMGLLPWKAFIENCEQLKIEVGFLFVIHSNNYEELEVKFKMNDFAFPVIYDPLDECNKLNAFPKEQKYQTFLLDAHNKVIMLGSPILNQSVSDLYLKTMLP